MKTDTENKCRQCKRTLPNNKYFYNGKNHKTCFSCSQKTSKISKNICLTCGIRARYNYKGEELGIYCKNHSLADMVDIKHPKCIICKVKQPTFNNEGETTALYCKECSLPDMVDIKSTKCIICKKKNPTFNKEGETKALYCKACSLPDMVNIKSPKCIVCKVKQPSYNKEGETKALYCKECSLPDMVNIKAPKCIVCKVKRPNYNNEGETKALYCKECSLPDMVDIKSLKCIVCKKRASYGIPCNKPNRCVQHKEEGMINKPTSRCRIKNCNNMSIYGSETPIHCELHKNDNDILLVERHCEKCNTLDVLLDGLCVNFCCLTEKGLQLKKYQKVKEKRVLKIVSCNFKEPTEYNIKIPYECGGKNSEEKEIGYDFRTHKVFIEVDEKQHKSYNKICEITRMNNIFQAEGGIPIVYLRYNPDNVMISGKKIKISQNNRETELIKWLKHYENYENIKKYITVHYLYYDEKLSYITYIDPDTCNVID